MGEKIPQRELDLIRSEVLQKYLEDRGIAPSALKHLNEAVRKAVEDDKTRALIESGKPIKVQPARKSWQDNVWLFLLVGIVIGVVTILIADLILS